MKFWLFAISKSLILYRYSKWCCNLTINLIGVYKTSGLNDSQLQGFIVRQGRCIIVKSLDNLLILCYSENGDIIYYSIFIYKQYCHYKFNCNTNCSIYSKLTRCKRIDCKILVQDQHYTHMIYEYSYSMRMSIIQLCTNQLSRQELIQTSPPMDQTLQVNTHLIKQAIEVGLK